MPAIRLVSLQRLHIEVIVHYKGLSFWHRYTLGVVHICQHLCISTESTKGEGGPRPAYYFLNVDIFVEHIIEINAGITYKIVRCG